MILVLIAIILDLKYPAKGYATSVVIRTLETIGLAVLIAAIFDFAVGTSEFINKIQSLLQDIIINRNFLGNIDAEGKRRALAALIKPSDIERRIYANLEDYYDTYINKTLDIANKCVRSDYRVTARVYQDTKMNRLVVEQDISYRVHPTKNGYDKIVVGFYDYDKDSTVDYVAINTPDGKRDLRTTFQWKEIGEGAERARISEISLDEIGKGHSHLNIELKVHEYGHDHWIVVGWHALQPTDGFQYIVQCENNIRPKSINTFVHGAKFHTDSAMPHEVRFVCNQWFNEGTGILVVAAICEETAGGTKITQSEQGVAPYSAQSALPVNAEVRL